VIAAYTDLAPGRAAEVPTTEFQIAYVENLARITSELGASIIRVFTAYESDHLDLNSLWTRAVAALREMCDRAGSYGVTLAIQNHHDMAIDTSALLELLADIDRPNCKLGFDAWSCALRGENLGEAAQRAAPHVAITTNADYIRVPRHRYRTSLVNYERQSPDWVRAVPFGAGCIDFGAFFRGLVQGGFKGLAVYEMCSPLRGGGSLENLDLCARQYLHWMRRESLLS
jgi:sugar phosphate isomerase/epimerase